MLTEQIGTGRSRLDSVYFIECFMTSRHRSLGVTDCVQLVVEHCFGDGFMAGSFDGDGGRTELKVSACGSSEKYNGGSACPWLQRREWGGGGGLGDEGGGRGEG